MRNNTGSFVGVILLGLLFLFGGKIIAQDAPDDMTIDNQGYKRDRKPPVEFTHLNHAEDYEIACTECHHEYEEGKNVWEEGNEVKKCVSCHNLSKSEGNIKKASIAFHRNCKGCHRELAKTGVSEDAPYKQCTSCHERES